MRALRILIAHRHFRFGIPTTSFSRHSFGGYKQKPGSASGCLAPPYLLHFLHWMDPLAPRVSITNSPFLKQGNDKVFPGALWEWLSSLICLTLCILASLLPIFHINILSHRLFLLKYPSLCFPVHRLKRKHTAMAFMALSDLALTWVHTWSRT